MMLFNFFDLPIWSWFILVPAAMGLFRYFVIRMNGSTGEITRSDYETEKDFDRTFRDSRKMFENSHPTSKPKSKKSFGRFISHYDPDSGDYIEIHKK